MEFVARPYAAAAAALVAGGLVAAAPVVATLPGVQLRDVALTTDASLGDFLSTLASQQLSAGSSLLNGFLDSNGTLTAGQIDQIPDLAAALAGSDATGFQTHAANDGLEQFFDANNAVLGMNQAGLLGLLGVRGSVDDDGNFTSTDLLGLNESLMTDVRHANSIPFAGLESAIGHYIGAAAFIGAVYDGSTSGQDVEGGETGQAFTQLVGTVTNFNQALLAAEQNFNTDLVSNQVALEQAVFGDDSALNGVVNRGFNSFNMLFDAQQQGLNGILGITGYDPQELTSSLLQGSDAQVFNDGSIGGLMGMFSQNLAMLSDLAGLQSSDLSGLFDNFNSADFSAASQALMETLAGGPFGDVFSAGGAFSDLMTDLGNVFTSAM